MLEPFTLRSMMKEEVYRVYSRSAFGFWFSYYTNRMRDHYSFDFRGCTQDAVNGRDPAKHTHTFFDPGR